MDIYGIVGSGLTLALVFRHMLQYQRRPALFGAVMTFGGCNALTVAAKVFGVVAVDKLYWRHLPNMTLHAMSHDEAAVLVIGGAVSILGCLAAIQDGIRRF